MLGGNLGSLLYGDVSVIKQKLFFFVFFLSFLFYLVVPGLERVKAAVACFYFHGKS